MMYLPDERHFDRPSMEAWIRDITQGGVLCLACDGNTIVGYLSIETSPFAKLQATGYVVLGVLQEYQKQSVGTRLLENGIAWSHSRLHRLELTVIRTNERAHRLYLKVGFVAEGIRREDLRVGERFIDEIYMGMLT